MVEAANGFAVVDTGYIPAIYDITLVHPNKILGKFFLKGFQGLKGADDIAILHKEIGGIVVGFQVKDVFGIQISVIFVRFKANGGWSILFWM